MRYKLKDYSEDNIAVIDEESGFFVAGTFPREEAGLTKEKARELAQLVCDKLNEEVV